MYSKCLLNWNALTYFILQIRELRRRHLQLKEMGYHPGYSCPGSWPQQSTQLSVSFFFVYFGRRLRFSRKRLFPNSRCYHCCLLFLLLLLPCLKYMKGFQQEWHLPYQGERGQCADIALRDGGEGGKREVGAASWCYRGAVIWKNTSASILDVSFTLTLYSAAFATS